MILAKISTAQVVNAGFVRVFASLRVRFRGAKAATRDHEGALIRHDGVRMLRAKWCDTPASRDIRATKDVVRLTGGANSRSAARLHRLGQQRSRARQRLVVVLFAVLTQLDLQISECSNAFQYLGSLVGRACHDIGSCIRRRRLHGRGSGLRNRRGTVRRRWGAVLGIGRRGGCGRLRPHRPRTRPGPVLGRRGGRAAVGRCRSRNELVIWWRR